MAARRQARRIHGGALPRPPTPALLALAALIVAAGLALAGPATAGAAGPAVQVRPISGPAETVELSQLGNPDVRADYVLRDSGGGQSTESVDGYSLESVLRAAGANVFSFSYLEVSRPGGGAVALTNYQVRNANAFPDGPPVIFDDGGSAGFLRPSAGGSDANAGDRFSTGTLKVRLRSGALLDVSASASKTKIKAGDTITFSAKLMRSAAGQEVSFSWSFDDGARGSGARVTHRFRKAGSYHVVVSVTAPGDSTGNSDVVAVQVGKLKKDKKDRPGGGNNKDDKAPDSGPSDGPGGDDYGDGGGSGDGAGTGQSRGSDRGGPDGAGQPERTRKRDRRSEAAPDDTEPVRGELLDVDEARPQDVAEEQQSAEERSAARTGTPQEADGFGVPGAAIGVLGVLGLLGTGALVELERLRPAALAGRWRELLGKMKLPWR